MKRSFYSLEIFVHPGGSRMSWLFIVDDLATLRKILQYYFDQDGVNLSLYHLLSYGTHIVVQTYQHGVKTQTIDMLPLIQVAFSGFAPFHAVEFKPAVGNDGEWFYELKEEETQDIVQIELSEFQDILFQSYDNEIQLTWSINVDWDKAGIEELTGTRIGKFDKVGVHENYVDKSSERYAGVHNTEFGGFSNVLDWDNLFDLVFEDQEYYEIELGDDGEFCEICLNEAKAAVDLNSFGFTWFQPAKAAEYSDYDYVPLAERLVGDGDIWLKYNFRDKAYELNFSNSINMKADLHPTFFQHVLDRYVNPALALIPVYGTYDRSMMNGDMIGQIRMEGALGEPRALDITKAKRNIYSLGSGSWERMIGLEETLIKHRLVFAKPVALASFATSIQKEVSQFYTIFSASLVTIRMKQAGPDYQLFLEGAYIPDPENHRSTAYEYERAKVKKLDMPLDLYTCLKDLESFMVD